MPKIIENVREQLLAEAKRQIEQNGYAKTTIRSVAGACDIAVGTVYNYFKSKEVLVGSFVLEAWREHLNTMKHLPSNDPKELLGGIYDSIIHFAESNSRLFSDADAAKLISEDFSKNHRILRNQIAEFVSPVCDGDEFKAEFIAEAIICWSVEKEDFERVYPLMEKIIKK